MVSLQSIRFWWDPDMPDLRVFLSYAWEDDAYCDWVERLARRLRKDGVDARLDRWHLDEGTAIAAFMNREVRHADRVLILCSPSYRIKVHQTEDGEKVTGSGWEAGLVADQVFANLGGARGKALPVLTRGAWEDAAPDFLLGLVFIDLSEPDQFEDSYLNLLRRLTGQLNEAPELGKLPEDLKPPKLEPLGQESSERSEEETAETAETAEEESPRADVSLIFQVGETGDGSFVVALSVDGGDAISAPLNLDLASSQTALEIAAVTQGDCTADDVQNLGSELWIQLQGGDIEEAVAAARLRCRQNDGVLQVHLALPPSLDALPWESLFDFEEASLATSPASTVARVLPDANAVAGHEPAPAPIRMLLVLPAGSGLASDAEWEKIQQVVRPTGDQAVIERLDGDVTPELLAKALREDWDVVHYIGHGKRDELGRVKLRFNAEGGGEHWMSAQTFAQQFLRSSVQLVVLNCCHAGAVPAEGVAPDDLGGLGAYLLKARVPAVVVMRYEISDHVAADFSRALYHELLDGRQPGRIDLAVQEGRATLLRTYGEGRSARAYVTPALYMAPGAEQLFALVQADTTAVGHVDEEAIDPRLPEKLIHALSSGRCLPILGPDLLGAGAHRDAGIAPDPGELARQLGKTSQYPDIDQLVALATTSASWLRQLIFERICQHVSAVSVEERFGLTSAIQERYRSFDPPDLLARVATWPVPGIVYSHVDGLLERALFQAHGRNLRVVGPGSLDTAGPPTPGETLLFNLRGNYAVPQSMVLTESDRDQVLDKMQDISEMVESRMNAVSGCTLLFLGVSPRDQLVRALGRRLLRAQVAKNRGTAYFVSSSSSAADKAYWLEHPKLEWLELESDVVLHGLGVAAGRASE